MLKIIVSRASVAQSGSPPSGHHAPSTAKSAPRVCRPGRFTAAGWSWRAEETRAVAGPALAVGLAKEEDTPLHRPYRSWTRPNVLKNTGNFLHIYRSLFFAIVVLIIRSSVKYHSSICQNEFC